MRYNRLTSNITALSVIEGLPSGLSFTNDVADVCVEENGTGLPLHCQGIEGRGPEPNSDPFVGSRSTLSEGRPFYLNLNLNPSKILEDPSHP